MPISDTRMEFAATIFVRECLRQFLKQHPGTPPEDMPMKAFAEYPPRQQQALIAAVGKAIEAATGMNDAYRTFVEQKIEVARERGTKPHETV